MTYFCRVGRKTLTQSIMLCTVYPTVSTHCRNTKYAYNILYLMISELTTRYWHWRVG